jgi:hypothetical protein
MRTILQPTVSRWIVLIGTVLFLCIGIATALAFLRPTSIHSHEDQIADALTKRGIAYQQIMLGERWPDHINFQYGEQVFPYGYRIRVRMPDGRIVDGWLTCAKLERDCTLSIADLQFSQLAVRNFTPASSAFIPDWLAPYLRIVVPI